VDNSPKIITVRATKACSTEVCRPILVSDLETNVGSSTQTERGFAILPLVDNIVLSRKSLFKMSDLGRISACVPVASV